MFVFAGDDEGLDHLGVNKVAVELIEFVEPEVVAVEVECCFRRVVGISGYFLFLFQG